MENNLFGKTYQFNRFLAEIIGLNEAIVLCQIHYCLELNKKAKKNYYDEKFWTFNSFSNWRKKYFPFWNLGMIKRTFYKLEKSGILITGNYNKIHWDQTKWYTIDYQKLEKVISEIDFKNIVLD